MPGQRGSAFEALVEPVVARIPFVWVLLARHDLVGEGLSHGIHQVNMTATPSPKHMPRIT
jgi:hypothetical protein